jgi:hypothetical protein
MEAGDHYARAMASYGAYLAACGFEYHGPKGYIAFAPRLSPGKFSAAFTAAQGWGSFAQQTDRHSLEATISVKWGKLRLKAVALSPNFAASAVQVTVDERHVSARVRFTDGRALVELADLVDLAAGARMSIKLT